MSRIDELIAKYCPNGVNHKELWKLTTWDKKFNGVDKSMQPKVIKYPYLLAADMNTLETEQGNVRLLATGVGAEKYTTEKLAGSNLCEGEIVAIPWGGTPNVKYYKGKFVTADNRIATSNDTTILNNKFLYYYLCANLDLITSFYRGAGIQHPHMKSVLTMKIPVPPLAVQEEIVNILDSFTLLEAELEAELEARKKQYEHYRDKLLNFADISQGGVRTMAINQLCEVSRGRVMSKDYLRENIGDYPVYSSQTANNGELGKINTFDYDGEYLTWTTDGANAGSVFYRNGKFSVTNVCGLLKSKTNDVSMKYLSYCLGNVAKKYVNEGMGNPKLMSNVMEKIKVPIPPLEEQERIVSILDKFDALVNDISDGLPAEINARRQQYEYYRDKLLNFEPIAA